MHKLSRRHYADTYLVIDMEGSGIIVRESPYADSPSIEVARRPAAAAEFRGLATVPVAVEWFANFTNPRTRRAFLTAAAIGRFC